MSERIETILLWTVVAAVLVAAVAPILMAASSG